MIRKTLNRMLSVMVAFIIFGFIDNFLMIIFGDEIDSFFLGIGVSNTLLAAGLGNTLSDAVGILTGRWVEKLIHMKLPPTLSNSLSKNQVILAETLGIILGCLIGLIPLLFI
ncbi:MAG: Unknown protein [uncultured Campylobacterales bacterium]|uniref:Uncharacterized protein n=1 Tax=uncultured Campylobacterales bacterium TaxID=352960 RepID=A0A6S6SZ71_9BACT|nr:MAG: Unknown protein [uncultured Campylobacterales bacterium]